MLTKTKNVFPENQTKFTTRMFICVRIFVSIYRYFYAAMCSISYKFYLVVVSSDILYIIHIKGYSQDGDCHYRI